MTLPFTVYPECGLENEEQPDWSPKPGVYDVPLKLPTNHRLVIAVSGKCELIHAALIEPGGDIVQATADLYVMLDAAEEQSGLRIL